MAKRYGRNQKRKHLVEVSQLREAHRMTEALLKHVSAAKEYAEKKVTDMVRIIESVTEYSIALPVKSARADSVRGHYQVAVLPKVDLADVTNNSISPTAPMLNRVDLYALRLFLEENSEAFQVAVHLQYAAGGHSVYAISEKALQSIPEEYLVQSIVPEIAKSLVEYLRKEQQHGTR